MQDFDAARHERQMIIADQAALPDPFCLFGFGKEDRRRRSFGGFEKVERAETGFESGEFLVGPVGGFVEGRDARAFCAEEIEEDE